MRAKMEMEIKIVKDLESENKELELDVREEASEVVQGQGCFGLTGGERRA